MGQQGTVHADLCGVLCWTGKCLAVPLSVSESWRRQVMLSWFTALFPFLTIYMLRAVEKKNSCLIISRSAERLQEH